MLDTKNPEIFHFNKEPFNFDILGGIKLSGLDRLRVTLRITKTKDQSYPLRNSLDLYQAEQTEKLITQIANYYQADSQGICGIVNDLISSLEEFRFSSLDHLFNSSQKKAELTAIEKKAALELLNEKQLLKAINEKIGATGVVGEEMNRLLLYIIHTSRRASNPLHAIILGASGEGKTYLQEKVSALIPTEEQINITALTENALYYFDEHELDGKLITIEDLDGALAAMYPIRELQSKHQLSKTYTQRDSKGNMRTITHVVKGKVVVSGCTTKEAIYEDNANRSILLHVDESKAQDERILAYHRNMHTGKINAQAIKEIQQLMCNVQRLIKPVQVINPYAQELQLPSYVGSPRRTMAIYLSVIETITLLHQYQRKIKKVAGVPTIETSKRDIAWAAKLLKDTFLHKSDVLTRGCRNFFESIKQHLAHHQSRQFYSRDIRTLTTTKPSTQRKYLYQLVQEGLLQIKSGSRASGFLYELTDLDHYAQVLEELALPIAK